MTNLLQELQKIGFTGNQARVYLALYDENEAKAGKIIDKTNLHRNIVYTCLKDLVQKKLVSVSKSGGVYKYKTLSPSRLLAVIEEKEVIAKKVIEDLTTQIKLDQKQEITVYEGIDEFRRHVLKSFNQVKKDSVIRYMGISPDWYSIVGKEITEKISAIQHSKNLSLLALAKEVSPEDKSFVKNSKGLSKIKTSNLLASDTSGTEILDDRISIRSFVEPYFVVEIKHQSIAENYQKHFDFLWSLD